MSSNTPSVHQDDVTVADTTVAFETSGHTGQSVRWLRTSAQLRAEVDLVSTAVLGEVERVVCFAPPHHLFGRLYGWELPARNGIEVVDAWRDPLTPPVIKPGLATLFVCLPASWLSLRGVADQIARLPRAVALHGTAGAPQTAFDVITALANANFRAVEIFGSTEAGAIAVRDLPPSGRRLEPWKLLPDVYFADKAAAGDQPLAVRSPRLARLDGTAATPNSWRSSDLVRRLDERRFDFIGRTARMIKVNGIRCDLGSIESVVLDRFPQLDVVCVPVTDPVRGEHYELYYSTAPAGPDIPETEVLRAVAARFVAQVPVPRRVIRVDGIPRTATGKPRLEELTRLADDDTGTSSAVR